jgi:hypothetical protein
MEEQQTDDERLREAMLKAIGSYSKLLMAIGKL